jgi:hypothetical protein
VCVFEHVGLVEVSCLFCFVVYVRVHPSSVSCMLSLSQHYDCMHRFRVAAHAQLLHSSTAELYLGHRSHPISVPTPLSPPLRPWSHRTLQPRQHLLHEQRTPVPVTHRIPHRLLPIEPLRQPHQRSQRPWSWGMDCFLALFLFPWTGFFLFCYRFFLLPSCVDFSRHLEL